MALLQEGDLTGQRRPAHLDAAMLAIGGLGRRERQGRVIEEQLHVFKERALIALERQHIGAALIGVRSGDLALTGHGVGRDHHAGEAEHLEQLWDRGDLVRLVAHRPLSKHEALLGCPGRDQMQRRGSRRSVKGAPQGLTVERHHTRPALGKVAHERQKAGVELLWTEQPEHPRDRVVAGNAVLQGQELAQERLFSLSEQGHVRAVLAPAQHGAQGNHQDGVQIVKPGVARPWVLQIRKDRPKSFHRSPLPSPSRLPRRRPPARLTQPKFSSAITLGVSAHAYGHYRSWQLSAQLRHFGRRGARPRRGWTAMMQVFCDLEQPRHPNILLTRTAVLVSKPRRSLLLRHAHASSPPALDLNQRYRSWMSTVDLSPTLAS